jgi:hypothetical protein
MALLLLGAPLRAQDVPDEAHEARVNAIEMAHAFTDESFIVRDGFWRTRLAPNEEVVCALQLFAGVDYWICLGSGTPEAQLQMGLFTSAPRPVAVLERVQEPSRAAIKVRPRTSGLFYLKVRNNHGQAARVCVTYCYK